MLLKSIIYKISSIIIEVDFICYEQYVIYIKNMNYKKVLIYATQFISNHFFGLAGAACIN